MSGTNGLVATLTQPCNTFTHSNIHRPGPSSQDIVLGNISKCVPSLARQGPSSPVCSRATLTMCRYNVLASHNLTSRFATDARILVWQQRLPAMRAVTPDATSESIASVINLQTFFRCCYGSTRRRHHLPASPLVSNR
jgi:hypothetical protein